MYVYRFTAAQVLGNQPLCVVPAIFDFIAGQYVELNVCHTLEELRPDCRNDVKKTQKVYCQLADSKAKDRAPLAARQHSSLRVCNL